MPKETYLYAKRDLLVCQQIEGSMENLGSYIQYLGGDVIDVNHRLEIENARFCALVEQVRAHEDTHKDTCMGSYMIAYEGADMGHMRTGCDKDLVEKGPRVIHTRTHARTHIRTHIRTHTSAHVST